MADWGSATGTSSILLIANVCETGSQESEKVTVPPHGMNRRSVRELNISVTAGARPDYLPSPACGEPPTSVRNATWCCQLQHSDLGERRA